MGFNFNQEQQPDWTGDGIHRRIDWRQTLRCGCSLIQHWAGVKGRDYNKMMFSSFFRMKTGFSVSKGGGAARYITGEHSPSRPFKRSALLM